MCIDKGMRKLFIGDCEGKLVAVNAKTGAVVKEFDNGGKTVTDILYLVSKPKMEEDEKQGKIVAAYSDGSIWIHNENTPSQ